MAKIIIKSRFATTPNDLLYDGNVSLRAKGLYGYIQAKPDNWDFSAERIARECKEGLQAVRSALRELEASGFLIRERKQNKKGFFEVEYILLAEVEKNLWTETDISDNHTTDCPTSGNRHRNIKKDSTKKELINKEDKPPAAFSMHKELINLSADKDLVSDWLKVRKTKNAANTKTALKGFLTQVEKSGKTLNEVLTICIEKSWKGFNASWQIDNNFNTLTQSTTEPKRKKL